jgi:hypothetical protein
MQAALYYRCVAIDSMALRCHRVVVTSAAPATQAATLCRCIAIVVASMATQLSTSILDTFKVFEPLVLVCCPYTDTPAKLVPDLGV